MLKRWIFSGICIALVSCGNNSNLPNWVPQAGDLKDGINVISSDLGMGVRGAIKESDKIVFFEARRGEKTDSEMLAADPDAPEYSVDARFFDDKGRVFSVVVGGDGLQDKSWLNEPDSAIEASSSEREEHFRLARKLIDGMEMTRSAADSAVSPEWEQLMLLAGSSDADETDMLIEEDAQTEEPEFPRLAGATANRWTHQITAYKKTVTFTFGKGEHSATWTKQKYPDGKCCKQVITCNHGACADASSMSKYCSRSYSNRTTDITSFLSQSRDTYKGYCTTSYGFTSGKHVCNDDTRVQLLFVKNDGGACYGFCGDSILQNYAVCPL